MIPIMKMSFMKIAMDRKMLRRKKEAEKNMQLSPMCLLRFLFLS